MRALKINWLAALAIGLGLYSVTANIDQVGTGHWLAGLAVGLVGVTAWHRDQRIGIWLVGASAALWVAGVVIGGPRSPESLALTAGACAGMLLALAGVHLIAARRK